MGNRSRGKASAQHIQTPFFSYLQTRSHWKSVELFWNDWVVCNDCQSGDATVEQMVSDIDNIQPSEENFYDQSDHGQTDQSSSNESSGNDTDDDAIRPGDIVWGLHINCMHISWRTW